MAPLGPAERARRVFKAYDVRGEVGDELDLDLVTAVGTAVGELLVGEDLTLVVGRDMRPSSPGFADAIARGARSVGVDVVDIGLASTDQVTYASGELGAASVMVTASHNPAGANGLKFTRPDAVPVSLDAGLAAVRDRAVELLSGAEVQPRRPQDGAVRELDLGEGFAAHVRSFVALEGLAPVSVAVDAGNGMAGLLWPLVTRGLPIETTPLYFELDGTFPNHPANPLDPANLVDLQRAVREGGHDLGLAFDGDADRVFAVDEHGRAVDSSLLGALMATRLLARDPGATVLHNLICSSVVPETIRAAGGHPLRTRVGHSLIKAQMAQTDAIFACEHSGHFYFRDNHRADSGLIAALLVIEAVAQAGQGLSEVLAPYDRTARSGELSFAVADTEATLTRVAHAFEDRARHDHLDGLTLTLPDGAWVNLRASNTESLLRCNVEAVTSDAMATLRDEVVGIVTGQH